ncbi:MAG: TetR/AcrR family transcriptional regulator [Actinomycetota bacterium]
MKHRPDQILDAAVAVFAAEGVGVSTSRLAKAAGVSNGTLFNYFPTKQELLDALYLRLKEEMATAIGRVDPDAPLKQQARSLWNNSVAWATAEPERRQVARLLHEAGLVSASAAAVAEALFAAPIEVMHRLEQSGVMADLPVGYVGALTQMQLELAVEHGLTDLELDNAFEVMWNSITTPIPTPTGDQS